MLPPNPPLPAPAPVLILLHGAGLNHAMWNPVKRHLDPRWPVMAIDLPGHGSRRDDHYTLQGAADAVADAARAAGPARVVLVGDSLGGYSAMAAADRLPPGQLAGLVIGGCTHNMVGVSWWQLHWRKWLLQALIPLMGEQRLGQRSLNRLMHRAGYGDDEIEPMLAAHIRMRGFVEAADALSGLDFLPRAAAIEAPILFVNGEQDALPLSHEAEFVAAAPHASSQHLDCEHGVSLWRSREFASLVNDFVEHLPNPPRARTLH